MIRRAWPRLPRRRKTVSFFQASQPITGQRRTSSLETKAAGTAALIRITSYNVCYTKLLRWLSAYVSNFLVDAREQGFAVPPEMEKKALDYLLKGLQEGVAGLPRGPLAYNENSVSYNFV